MPSVVNRSAVMDLHRSRSCVTLIQSLYDIFVHSLMLSVHIVLGLARPLLPFILPSISNRCTPSPLIMCPKYWHFLCLIVFNNDLLVVMSSEPLTLFVGSSASSNIPVFVHLKGWRPLCTSPFKVDDTLYLVLHARRGEVPWCGHRCALPIPRSHNWELCSCGRPVFLSTSILTRMHGWQSLQR